MLYNKPFRKINRPQLVNAITQKETVVEVEFEIGNKQYLIRRGIKPAIFDIIIDGKLLNQSSNAREYQDALEQTILKMNHKSFSQIVILGSANFMPFMQLTAQDRREVIEDLLDIQIFSTMNVLLKERIALNKSAILDTVYRIDMAEQKIELHRTHLDALKRNNTAIIDQKHATIAGYYAACEELEEANETLRNFIAEFEAQISDKGSVSSKMSKIVEMERKLETRIKNLKKDMAFFEENDNCPTCLQGIDERFKTETVADRRAKSQEIVLGLEKLESEYVKTNTRLVEIEQVTKKINEFSAKIVDNNSEIKFKRNHAKLIADEIEQLSLPQKINTTSVEELNSLNVELGQLRKTKEDLVNQREVFEVAAYMLKDGGIKTKIIRQYIPVINKLINKYLAAMDFFCQFELDENFNEKIKSRFRDEFSYASFSEGEKLRIDLAILFAWRAVAKMRNSASTNLLIMDEVFDSSLDTAGTEEFIKILETLTDKTNTFIISHKGATLFDKFHSVIRFVKNKNFSMIGDPAGLQS